MILVRDARGADAAFMQCVQKLRDARVGRHMLLRVGGVEPGVDSERIVNERAEHAGDEHFRAVADHGADLRDRPLRAAHFAQRAVDGRGNVGKRI